MKKLKKERKKIIIMIFRFFSKLLQAPKIPEVPMNLFPRAMVVRTKLPTPPEPV